MITLSYLSFSDEYSIEPVISARQMDVLKVQYHSVIKIYRLIRRMTDQTVMPLDHSPSKLRMVRSENCLVENMNSQSSSRGKTTSDGSSPRISPLS